MISGDGWTDYEGDALNRCIACGCLWSCEWSRLGCAACLRCRPMSQCPCAGCASDLSTQQLVNRGIIAAAPEVFGPSNYRVVLEINDPIGVGGEGRCA